MSREVLGLAIALVGLAIVAWAVVRAARSTKAPEAPPSRRAASRPRAAGAAPAPEPREGAQDPLRAAAAQATARLDAPRPGPGSDEPIPSVLEDERDDDDLTLITLRSHVERAREGLPLDSDDTDDDVAAATRAHPILFDEDAGVDEPTGPVSLILVSGAAVTDRGKVRRRNEDAYLTDDARGLFVVADGMGGYAGGDVASRLAVETMTQAFAERAYGDTRWAGLPRWASELAGAIERANGAVYAQATSDPHLAGMGTTVVAARFSPKKQRLYLGHVGDSRCYRVRGGALTAMTEDHTLASLGVEGPAGGRLVRAVGIDRHVEIDLIIAKPAPGDVYLLCSDGLTKMASEEAIAARVAAGLEPQALARSLVDLALEEGGKDNVTVVVVRVQRAMGSSARPPAASAP